MWTQWTPYVRNDITYFSCSKINTDDTIIGDVVYSVKYPCDKYQNMDYYGGSTRWIFIVAVTGTIVGLIRAFTNYPDDMAGLFKEIYHYRVDPTWAPLTLLLSAISLAGGACLGPEQALVGQLIAKTEIYYQHL